MERPSLTKYIKNKFEKSKNVQEAAPNSGWLNENDELQTEIILLGMLLTVSAVQNSSDILANFCHKSPSNGENVCVLRLA
jgi:hypothetical protein